MPQDSRFNAPVIDGPSPTGALNPTYPGSNFPTYPSPTPLAPALAPLVNSSSRSEQLIQVSQAEAVVWDDRMPLTTPNVHHAEAQEFRSGQAKDVTTPTTSVTQRCNTAVVAHQPAEEQRMPSFKASPQNQKQGIEG